MRRFLSVCRTGYAAIITGVYGSTAIVVCACGIAVIVTGTGSIGAIVAGIYGNVTTIDHNAFSFQSFVAFFNKDRSAMNDGVEIRMETVITGVYGDGSDVYKRQVQSYITRLMCFTSFTILLVVFPMTSHGISALSAVMKSVVVTARRAMA